MRQRNLCKIPHSLAMSKVSPAEGVRVGWRERLRAYRGAFGLNLPSYMPAGCETRQYRARPPSSSRQSLDFNTKWPRSLVWPILWIRGAGEALVSINRSIVVKPSHQTTMHTSSSQWDQHGQDMYVSIGRGCEDQLLGLKAFYRPPKQDRRWSR